ncbi:conserved hypothetical protein [Wolbachia pipientis wAlbB]|nr:conserved hypothetical protein [Wolbachia pipientis wAlbB]
MQKRSYIFENKPHRNKVIKIEGLNYFHKLRQNSSHVDMDEMG